MCLVYQCYTIKIDNLLTIKGYFIKVTSLKDKLNIQELEIKHHILLCAEISVKVDSTTIKKVSKNLLFLPTM